MSTYKVLSFDGNTGQLIIEFAEGFSPLSIDVPIENGLYITGEALDTYIKGFIPTWHLERQAQIKAGVPNEAEIASLAPTTPTAETTLNQNDAMWAELQFEKSIAKVLVKFGVLESDPTVIPVQTL